MAVTAVPVTGAPPVDTADRLPLSPAFLEFLAEWEDEQGNWQDPMAFADASRELPDEGGKQDDEND